MDTINAMQIVHEAIEAHGGMDYWSSIGALEAEISASGFLFTAKQRPVLHRVRMRAVTDEPRFTFFDFPKPGQTAELIGNDEVRILDGKRNIVAKRENPRAEFRGIRRQFIWDDLDFIYFAGYATWNYLTMPFILQRKGFRIEALEPLPGTLGQFTRLQVTFPADIPTHSRQQIFDFDDHRRCAAWITRLRLSEAGRTLPTCAMNTGRLTNSRLRPDGECCRSSSGTGRSPDRRWSNWKCIISSLFRLIRFAVWTTRFSRPKLFFRYALENTKTSI